MSDEITARDFAVLVFIIYSNCLLGFSLDVIIIYHKGALRSYFELLSIKQT